MPPTAGPLHLGQTHLISGKTRGGQAKSLNAEGAEENAKAATAPSATFAKPPRPLR